MHTSGTSHPQSSRELLSVLRMKKSGLIHCFTEKITKNTFTFLLNAVQPLFSLTFSLLSYTFLNLFTSVSTSSLNVKNCASAEERLWILTNAWNTRSVSKRNWNWFAGSENSVGWQCTSYSHFRLSCQIPSQWNLITRWWLGKHETNFSLIKEQVFCLLYVLSSWELWRNALLDLHVKCASVNQLKRNPGRKQKKKRIKERRREIRGKQVKQTQDVSARIFLSTHFPCNKLTGHWPGTG